MPFTYSPQPLLLACLATSGETLWRLCYALTGGQNAASALLKASVKAVSAPPLARPDRESLLLDEHDVLRNLRRAIIQQWRVGAAADFQSQAAALPFADISLEPFALAVRAVLDHLPVQQFEALLLRDVLEWDPRAAAVAMDCSVTATALHHARAVESILMPLGDQAALDALLEIWVAKLKGAALPANLRLTRTRPVTWWRRLLWPVIIITASVVAAFLLWTAVH